MTKRGWMGALLIAATALTPIAASAQDGGFGARQIRAAQREGSSNANADANRSQARADRQATRAVRQAARAERRGGAAGAPAPSGYQRGDGRRGDGQRGEGRGRRDGAVTGGTFDRNNNGRVDNRWDRNNNGRVDRQWDRNRDGQLDRRWDRNNDDRLDRRWDRNDNERLDRRYDRDRDGRYDRYDRYDNRNGRRWNQGWRSDRRYDWRSHRSRYGQVYRLGRYYSPYRSWSYRPLSIGFTLNSLFYSNRYWINDPWQYRLPDVYGPYRWVRYYDDALLVDIETGEVVDVIRSFFW